MTSVGILTRLDDPPAVLLEGRLELLELFMLKHVFTVHFILQIYDVCLRHDLPRVLIKLLNRIVLHVSVQLALGSHLVDTIDVIVNLVRQQILDDLDPLDLGKEDVGEHHAELLRLLIV